MSKRFSPYAIPPVRYDIIRTVTTAKEVCYPVYKRHKEMFHAVSLVQFTAVTRTEEWIKLTPYQKFRR